MVGEISIVVVTYNAGKYIIPCLQSIFNSRNVTIDKVIVVDNSSQDDTIEIIKQYYRNEPRINIVRLKRNYGFPLACNIGVFHANTEFVAIMNPDVILEPYCLSHLLSYIRSNSDIAAVQPKILHLGGYIDSAGCLIDILGHGFHIGKYEKDQGQYDVVKEIAYPTFACVIVRRNIYLNLGGMDPIYFLYNEDLDFGLRCWLSGYRVIYVPYAIAYHVGQYATRRMPYISLYFGRRNRLFTVFTCYPLPLAIILSFILIMSYLSIAITLRDKNEYRITLRAIISFFKNIRYLARKRMVVNRVRKQSIYKLIKQGLLILKFMGLILHVNKLYRRILRINEN